MQPEIPFLGAGAVSLIGGAIAEKHWPSNSLRAVIGTVALVIVASATTNTKFAPLVRAIGVLMFVVALMAAVKTVQQSKSKKKV